MSQMIAHGAFADDAGAVLRILGLSKQLVFDLYMTCSVASARLIGLCNVERTFS